MGHRFEPCRGHLHTAGKALSSKAFCLFKHELLPRKISALSYDISQAIELKKEDCLENCNHWL